MSFVVAAPRFVYFQPVREAGCPWQPPLERGGRGKLIGGGVSGPTLAFDSELHPCRIGPDSTAVTFRNHR